MRFGAAIFGALMQELVHWYDLREHLTDEKVARLLRSGGYWFITVLMVAGGAVGAIILGENLNTPQIVLFAAAFPTVFKKLVKAFKPAEVHLGERDSERVRLREYFE